MFERTGKGTFPLPVLAYVYVGPDMSQNGRPWRRLCPTHPMPMAKRSHPMSKSPSAMFWYKVTIRSLFQNLKKPHIWWGRYRGQLITTSRWVWSLAEQCMKLFYPEIEQNIDFFCMVRRQWRHLAGSVTLHVKIQLESSPFSLRLEIADKRITGYRVDLCYESARI